MLAGFEVEEIPIRGSSMVHRALTSGQSGLSASDSVSASFSQAIVVCAFGGVKTKRRKGEELRHDHLPFHPVILFVLAVPIWIVQIITLFFLFLDLDLDEPVRTKHFTTEELLTLVKLLMVIVVQIALFTTMLRVVRLALFVMLPTTWTDVERIVPENPAAPLLAFAWQSWCVAPFSVFALVAKFFILHLVSVQSVSIVLACDNVLDVIMNCLAATFIAELDEAWWMVIASIFHFEEIEDFEFKVLPEDERREMRDASYYQWVRKHIKRRLPHAVKRLDWDAEGSGSALRELSPWFSSGFMILMYIRMVSVVIFAVHTNILPAARDVCTQWKYITYKEKAMSHITATLYRWVSHWIFIKDPDSDIAMRADPAHGGYCSEKYDQMELGDQLYLLGRYPVAHCICIGTLVLILLFPHIWRRWSMGITESFGFVAPVTDNPLAPSRMMERMEDLEDALDEMRDTGDHAESMLTRLVAVEALVHTWYKVYEEQSEDMRRVMQEHVSHRQAINDLQQSLGKKQCEDPVPQMLKHNLSMEQMLSETPSATGDVHSPLVLDSAATPSFQERTQGWQFMDKNQPQQDVLMLGVAVDSGSEDALPCSGHFCTSLNDSFEDTNVEEVEPSVERPQSLMDSPLHPYMSTFTPQPEAEYDPRLDGVVASHDGVGVRLRVEPKRFAPVVDTDTPAVTTESSRCRVSLEPPPTPVTPLVLPALPQPGSALTPFSLCPATHEPVDLLGSTGRASVATGSSLQVGSVDTAGAGKARCRDASRSPPLRLASGCVSAEARESSSTSSAAPSAPPEHDEQRTPVLKRAARSLPTPGSAQLPVSCGIGILSTSIPLARSRVIRGAGPERHQEDVCSPHSGGKQHISPPSSPRHHQNVQVLGGGISPPVPLVSVLGRTPGGVLHHGGSPVLGSATVRQPPASPSELGSARSSPWPSPTTVHLSHANSRQPTALRLDPGIGSSGRWHPPSPSDLGSASSCPCPSTAPPEPGATPSQGSRDPLLALARERTVSPVGSTLSSLRPFQSQTQASPSGAQRSKRFF